MSASLAPPAKARSTDVPYLYALTLDDDGSPEPDKTYVRIPLSEKDDLLRFVLKPGSLASGNHAMLHINYPIQGSFDRSTFYSVNFIIDPNLLHAYCDIALTVPGAYEYYVDYQVGQKTHRSQSGYVVVEPRLWVKKGATSEKALLPLDALMILSLVPKWMGPLSQWQSLIDMIEYEGYNMIHFVPMQQRGGSNSPYSIADQLAFSLDLFDEKDRNKSNEELTKLMQNMLEHIQSDHGILCLSDVVWNHTSFDSAFLNEHPEAGYNLHNSPHLVPAYELDTALIKLSGKLHELGLKSKVESGHDIDAIMNYIRDHTIQELKLYEYKVIDVQKQTEIFRKSLQERTQCDPTQYGHAQQLSFKEQAALLGKDAIQPGHLGTRFHRSVDQSRALSIVLAIAGLQSIDDVNNDHVNQLTDLFQRLLDEYNLPHYKEYDEDVRIALDNIKNRLAYTRLDANGPKLGEISESNPLIETYFTRLNQDDTTHPKGSMQLANNGWIWNADPLKDFAGPDSSAYLRREVIVWGDCVKLRYGQSPEENPWLWHHMRTYTEQIASMFQGIRIDNCHSTPIHVAEYLLDAARQVRPDLYVVAELFTGSPEKDNMFVSHLGIHSLIREAMQAWDPHELSRLVHRHGGKPVGSMDEAMIWKTVKYEGNQYDQVLRIPILQGSMPRALFMDCTHDNETPAQKRTPQDALPNAAAVAFSNCAIGSVKGYDEIYPKLLDIVNETRCYEPKPNYDQGIIKMKHQLQNLHLEMTLKGFTEVHVHQENDYLLVHRQHPGSQRGYLLISRTAFPGQHTGLAPIKLRGTKATFMFGGSLKVESVTCNDDNQYLHGFPSHVEELPSPRFEEKEDHLGQFTEVILPDHFVPGSIIVIKTSIGDTYQKAQDMVSYMEDDVVQDLDLLDCNIILYRCEGEEMDTTNGDGVYNIPNYGKLVYAGLQGFISVLRSIIETNDLGHPFCDNLRQGTWALDYVVNRLQRHLPHYPHLQKLHDWFQSRFELVREMPDFLVPKYFAMTVKTAYDKVYAHALSRMSPLIQNGDAFLHRLAMTSVQMYGMVPSTGLHPTKAGPSLAAGLPHFTNGPFRTWGRDVFISLRGLIMVTGRFDVAKEHIIAFAGSLKHGLIPNLLDSVRYPRYNSRDSVWFFMQAIQDYYHLAPDGHRILEEKVPRRFPKDDRFVEVDEAYKYSSTVAEVMQEIMERHANGIHFREHNAGDRIDRQMSDAGFNIDIEVDWETGILVGGNIWNCGTWMDKMGESEKAHNKGLPGTPRDGAPVEITGLLKSALRFILELNAANKFKWTGVEVNGKDITYEHWNDLLQKNFERLYYVPKDASEDDQYDVIPKIIHRRGIYKDVVKATKPYTEYQFRPNFPTAMCVAPELFNKDHARDCLKFTSETLLGPLGMRTLDPADQEYRPYYNNSDDSDDPSVAKGRNYHQGPEWLWLTGFFLRACFKFDALTSHDIARILRAHRKEITVNPWAGLAELTNKDAAPCWDSCTTQAWSSATLLDLMYDLIEG
ncbi:glycogen debranching enzyme [Radiomyces spectabilis]|uniref:glycogen debranching enzyme n=1 Tax=Radiomyces spectabilis TaxID=64574 RepID=UPI002220B163|nr:glycogen debranching enzyme [Radiomyces spectabilis]KAI8391335.1 glycogen debranching enzyme [Radiomyces spectabilis]